MKRTHFHRPQVTSAHAIAVLALVVGMAGSATAAALITGADIENGTVTSKDIKDKNLKLKDFKPSERKKLKGEPGPQGPQGPADRPVPLVLLARAPSGPRRPAPSSRVAACSTPTRVRAAPSCATTHRCRSPRVRR